MRLTTFLLLLLLRLFHSFVWNTSAAAAADCNGFANFTLAAGVHFSHLFCFAASSACARTRTHTLARAPIRVKGLFETVAPRCLCVCVCVGTLCENASAQTITAHHIHIHPPFPKPECAPVGALLSSPIYHKYAHAHIRCTCCVHARTRDNTHTHTRAQRAQKHIRARKLEQSAHSST